MKSREDVYSDLQNNFGTEDPARVVDPVVYAILEYVDDSLTSWEQLPVVGQVLRSLRDNIDQFKSKR